MKVYIVFKGCNDDSHIIAVFMRGSKAEQYVKNLRDDEYFIEEHKVTI